MIGAGLEVARALGAAGVETTVIDRRNHHLFQPLLYQMATAARLERLGVVVRTGATVEDVGPRSVTIGGEVLPTRLVVWAAGVAASPLAAQLGETDKAGRVSVDACLRVAGREDVFALGDVAACTGADGAPLPGLAQVARQPGIHLGRALAAHLTDGAALTPFRYASRGNTAIVGRNAAVFERDGRALTGWFAWFAWAVVHVYLLVGFPNRFVISVRWLWRYLTYERGTRLIAGEDVGIADPDAAPDHAAPRSRASKG